MPIFQAKTYIVKEQHYKVTSSSISLLWNFNQTILKRIRSKYGNHKKYGSEGSFARQGMDQLHVQGISFYLVLIDIRDHQRVGVKL